MSVRGAGAKEPILARGGGEGRRCQRAEFGKGGGWGGTEGATQSRIWEGREGGGWGGAEGAKEPNLGRGGRGVKVEDLCDHMRS